MDFESLQNRPTVVIGKTEALSASLPSRLDVPGLAVFGGRIPFYADLSIQANVQQLRMIMEPEAASLLKQLLPLSGLKKIWNKPFRRDLPGEKQLFGLMMTMATLPPLLLCYDPLAGMTTPQREAFARLLDCFCQTGRKLVYTAPSLKDAMRLELEQNIFLSRADGFARTDSEAVRALCAGLGSPEQQAEVYRKLEEGAPC